MDAKSIPIPDVGQQVVDEHLRNLRHFLPDERVAAWSQARYDEARVLEGRRRALENERRQKEVSLQKKELKRRMNQQKVIFKEQIEREAKEQRVAAKTAYSGFMPDSVPAPPPMPHSVPPPLVVYVEHTDIGQPRVYYDFASSNDVGTVLFKRRI